MPSTKISAPLWSAREDHSFREIPQDSDLGPLYFVEAHSDRTTNPSNTEASLSSDGSFICKDSSGKLFHGRNEGAEDSVNSWFFNEISNEEFVAYQTSGIAKTETTKEVNDPDYDTDFYWVEETFDGAGKTISCTTRNLKEDMKVWREKVRAAKENPVQRPPLTQEQAFPRLNPTPIYHPRGSRPSA